MNRFEEQFKDVFEHFEPEVDPKLWQQISQQLPSASQVNPGASATGKSIIAKLGIKGIAALIAGATLTALSIWYVSEKKEMATVPPSVVPSEQKTNAGLHQQTENTKEESTTASFTTSVSESATNPSENNSNRPQQSSTSVQPAAQNLPQTALTGDNNAGNGESGLKTGSPFSQKEAVTTASHSGSNASSTSNHSTVNQEVLDNTQNIKPVLLLSSKGGFAPLTITALTNQSGTRADYDFGDGSSPLNGTSANHVYTEPGLYTIQCTINGSMLEQNIQVIGQIPSAFSPNGDGVNDFFTISNIEDLTVEIRIFSRNGKVMYNSKGNVISWDGKTPDGLNAEAGTYLYDIFATSEGGSSYKQKGTIHLFR